MNVQLSVLGLVECLNKIIREMNKNNNSARKRHFVSGQACLVTEDTHLKDIKANEELNSCYRKLCKEISNKEYCKTLFINMRGFKTFVCHTLKPYYIKHMEVISAI